MTAAHVETSAFIRSSVAAAEPIRQGMAAARSGFMSVEDAAALRDAVEEFERLHAEGVRLATDLDCPEFTAWVEGMLEVGAGPRKMVDSMRPVLSN